MGAHLSVGYVCFLDGLKPNWDAAKQMVEQARLGDEQLMERFRYVYKSYVSDEDSSDEEILEFANKAIDYVKFVYENEPRDASFLLVPAPGGTVRVLLVGGMSYGDPADGTVEFNFFADSGLAKAAGFLDEPVYEAGEEE